MIRLLARGHLLGAEYQCLVLGEQYVIRLEESPRAHAFAFALGEPVRQVVPAEDGGRSWLEVHYTEEVANLMRELVDFAGDAVFHQPNFGQMLLFDEAGFGQLESVNG